MWSVWPKDDLNNTSPGLTSITDDEGRIVYYGYTHYWGTYHRSYTQDSSGGPVHVEFNPRYEVDSNGQIVLDAYEQPKRLSYCAADYYYDGAPSDDAPLGASPVPLGIATKVYYTTGRLARVVNNYYECDANGDFPLDPTGNPIPTRLLSENDYTYDNVGNRLDNTLSYLDANGDLKSRTEHYQYDHLNRLDRVDYDYGTSPQDYQTYHFDAMGNRDQKTDGLGATESYGYDNANRLTLHNVRPLSYDLNGNLENDGTRQNTWDSQNRLVRCIFNGHTSTFSYGADGLRRSMTVDGVTTHFLLDGQSVVKELSDVK